MEYQEFKDLVFLHISNELPKNTSVQFQQVRKTNDVVLDGLTFRENSRNICPTIYLNSYYEDYCSGKDISTIVQHILHTYELTKPKENIDLQFFTDYEQVKPHIVFRLINYEKNQQLLKEVPFIGYLDLAIVFYYLMDNSENGYATILIRQSHLDYWQVSIHELYQQAKKNTPLLLSCEVENLFTFTKQALEQKGILDIPDLSDTPPLFVLSNKNHLFGAGCILYTSILEDFGNKIKSNFYILPSSVHEVILYPSQKNDQYFNLSQMVQDINRTQVAEEEVLSDHVYFYNRSERQICM